MEKNKFIVMVVISVVLAAILGSVFATMILRPPGPDEPAPAPLTRDEMQKIRTLNVIKTIVSCVNIGLIIPLLVIFVDIYREVKSKFTMGLISVMLVLFLYALTSNPLIHLLFGYMAVGFSPFSIIPDICTTFALMVLLYLNIE